MSLSLESENFCKFAVLSALETKFVIFSRHERVQVKLTGGGTGSGGVRGFRENAAGGIQDADEK